jgi:1-deoxy-D-xylulose-5-phosphate synthase
MAPKDASELHAMLAMALAHDGPCAIRYPRGKVPPAVTPLPRFGMGEAEVLAEGADLAILALGSTVGASVEAAARLAAAGMHVAVVNMRFVKPLDRDLLVRIARTVPRILTVEENAVQGGFGSAVIEELHGEAAREAGLDARTPRVRTLGIPDAYVEQGTQAEMRRLLGLDAEGILAAAQGLMRDTPAPHADIRR